MIRYLSTIGNRSGYRIFLDGDNVPGHDIGDDTATGFYEILGMLANGKGAGWIVRKLPLNPRPDRK